MYTCMYTGIYMVVCVYIFDYLFVEVYVYGHMAHPGPLPRKIRSAFWTGWTLGATVGPVAVFEHIDRFEILKLRTAWY